MVLDYPKDGDQYWKRETVQAIAGTSLPIILPGWLTDISVAVILGTATAAKAQYTLDPEIDLDTAPAGADWIDWDAGDVTVDSGFPANSSVTGVRIITTGGSGTLKVAGRRMAARIR